MSSRVSCFVLCSYMLPLCFHFGTFACSTCGFTRFVFEIIVVTSFASLLAINFRQKLTYEKLQIAVFYGDITPCHSQGEMCENVCHSVKILSIICTVHREEVLYK